MNGMDLTRSNTHAADGIAVRPNGGDGRNYMMFYVGPAYEGVNRDTVESYAAAHGMRYIYWASDESCGYAGIYNGDTLVAYRDAALLPDNYKEDARRYGEPIWIRRENMNDMKLILTELKERQKSGIKMNCPRCGEDRMNENPIRNALSRYADVYICDECGTDEALRDFFGNPLPLDDWYVFCEKEEK